MAKNTIKNLKTTKRTTSFNRWFNNKPSESNLLETSKNVKSFDRFFNTTNSEEVNEENTDNEETQGE